MLTAFLVLFLSASAAHGAPTILHHDLSVVLHPESNTMSAADTMQIRPVGASRLSFTLAEGALVSRLSVDGKDYPLIPFPFPFRKGMLGFPVPEEHRQGTLKVFLGYGATFNDPIPDHPVHAEETGPRGWLPILPTTCTRSNPPPLRDAPTGSTSSGITPPWSHRSSISL